MDAVKRVQRAVIRPATPLLMLVKSGARAYQRLVLSRWFYTACITLNSVLR